MSNQEEVYVITPYQVSEAIAEGKKIYYNHLQRHWCFCFTMALLRLEEFGKRSFYANFTEGKNIISLKDTVRNHEVMIPGLLSIHAISDCNTVPMFHGVARKEKS